MPFHNAGKGQGHSQLGSMGALGNAPMRLSGAPQRPLTCICEVAVVIFFFGIHAKPPAAN